MKQLKQILIIVVVLLSIMSCNRRSVKSDRLSLIINDTSESITVYNGLKLGATHQEEDLIIKNDTSSYLLSGTGLYRDRKDKSELYRGYLGRYSHYTEDPPFYSRFLDYYLENSYRGDIIIDFNNDGKREYKAVTGWYSYQTFKDTVYSVTCVFDGDNIKPEEISDYITGFQNVLIKKYGNPNVSKPYFGDNLEICVFLPDTTGKANDDLYWNLYKPVKHLGLKVVDSSFWMKGRYEIQLFINESNRYHSEYGTEYGNYEFIIRYVDNKFLIRHIEEMEKVKKQKNEQFEQNNQKLELQRQTELINAQKNQHI